MTVGSGNQNATNLQEDESFSARPIFNSQTNTATSAGQVNSTTALFVDLKTTMNTLLKTIHNTNVLSTQKDSRASTSSIMT